MTSQEESKAAFDVSVLTPSFGYGRYLQMAIDSVMRDASLNIELIVQDAGSPDETEEVLREAQRVYGSSLKWSMEEDKGQSDALNKALNMASGRWIGWLNADEFYLPGGLAQLVREGDRTNADVVYGDAVFVDEQGALSRLKPQHPFNDLVLRDYGAFISTCATVFRRDALWDRPWDVHLRLLMDQDLYLKLAHRGARFRYTPYPVAAFRVHPERVSAETSTLGGDYAIVQGRHGRGGRLTKACAWALHAVYKATSGGYRRQRRAESLVGKPMTWTTDTDAREKVDELLRRCYTLGQLERTVNQ